MIPKQMEAFLREALPEQTWRNRLRHEGPLAFMEFRINDVDRLNRLGIHPDKLGPHLVVCMWDVREDLEVGGYLVVDNLAMGRPSMGGIRMLPTVTPAAIFNLARGMTLKNAAADLPYGGGKAGIVAPDRAISDEEHREILRRFAHLIGRYRSIYLPGPDVGTNDADMKIIAIENGIDSALSKPVDMGGNRIDELGAAAGGVVIAIDALLEQMPRLKALPQFRAMRVPKRAAMTILIQGFGAVGAHVAEMLTQLDPAPQIVGVSDAHGYLFRAEGLPVGDLLARRDARGLVTFRYFLDALVDKRSPRPDTKFSNASNDLLREDAFCFVPAAPIARYLDVDASSRPAMTVDRMGRWSMIVEGANTYSPSPARRAARLRMERTVYWQRGVVIATDFLVNSGGVIFAAQEHIIKTPDHLRFPREILGDAEAVERWLAEHQEALAELAAQRLQAGIRQREEVIRRNMKELVDFLVADPDMLPLEAAEQISITRITQRERFRPIRYIMEPLTLIEPGMPMRQAAQLLVDDPNEMLGVVREGRLLGVVTDWDITHATAQGLRDDLPVSEIMSRDVITVGPEATIPDVLQLLESHEITAMPVVDDGAVVGVISSHILTRKALTRMLQG
ncbi:MAG TPA: CBS domain-containing protein [Anaerolineae bacterium]|nr:CBS domain-containing protein [Caldilineae bacterium]HID35697.1 CBS domain-containing protein [Anaerolineae bacterium]